MIYGIGAVHILIEYMNLRVIVKVQYLVNHSGGIAVNRQAHGFNHLLSFFADFPYTADHRGGECIFEQGKLISPAVDFRGGQDGAGNVVDYIACIDHAFKYILIGSVFHYAF